MWNDWICNTRLDIYILIKQQTEFNKTCIYQVIEFMLKR